MNARLPQNVLEEIHQLPNEALRLLIAHAAGLHAARDGDGGARTADTLRRVADRLPGRTH